MTAKIKVKTDQTVRTITVAIELEPDDRSWDLKDLTLSWREPKPFAPDTAKITLRDGKFSAIYVSGLQVLKGGRLSESLRDAMMWRPNAFAEVERIENAPDWVRFLAEEAPKGVTSWTMPEAS